MRRTASSTVRTSVSAGDVWDPIYLVYPDGRFPVTASGTSRKQTRPGASILMSDDARAAAAAMADPGRTHRVNDQSAGFRYTRRVQFSETDMAGIVHFSAYFRFMEEAEHALWRAAGVSIGAAEI